MDITRHCILCENQVKDLDTGLTCKLTKKAPDFYKKCPNIKLDKMFEYELHQANLNLHLILKKKNINYTKIIILAIFGIIIILGNEQITNTLRPLNYYWVYRVSLIGIGILIIINANFKMQSLLSQLKSVRFKKSKIDNVLDKYRIIYYTTFDYKKKIHGYQEIELTIKYKNWKKNNTTSLFIMSD
ncbi:hypothetical protein [Olleya sp. 1-3]|uniref:hypothetical protein n=1 Tax=Olleya sp. 1-3 TaxID=2058323 RepID=UPI000CC3FA52|nr:hypothetical protein [Olleya sp. 1-3]PKG50963.1 hypothetical protein CXF54_10175 [Olleya sp. 1-3]